MSVLDGKADSNYGISNFTGIVCKINVLSVGPSPKSIRSLSTGWVQEYAIVGVA